MGTDTKTYLEPLHSKFQEKFPHMTVSRQRLSDQRRAIVRNNLLPQQTIDSIYREVKEDLEKTHTQIQQTQQIQSHLYIQGTQQLGQRMRWTTEYNETIIAAYYKITKLETDKTSYRTLLHQHCVTAFPHLAHVSEQRVSDQRRVIINNRLISPERIAVIKEQVAQELQINDLEIQTNTLEQNTA
ncbi:hypothetical protein O3G_MSEX011139 [Manduca sexta]|uniref:Uncharacterized protein n=1 Tax=Manduca sexta TaxID=7130 RepID=A0A922CUV0_MANSE|nr:hypothetical protein O3G_MSEX011139 [Manduca sexta]